MVIMQGYAAKGLRRVSCNDGKGKQVPDSPFNGRNERAKEERSKQSSVGKWKGVQSEIAGSE